MTQLWIGTDCIARSVHTIRKVWLSTNGHLRGGWQRNFTTPNRICGGFPFAQKMSEPVETTEENPSTTLVLQAPA
jgi:hypothetical protein